MRALISSQEQFYRIWTEKVDEKEDNSVFCRGGGEEEEAAADDWKSDFSCSVCSSADWLLSI